MVRILLPAARAARIVWTLAASSATAEWAAMYRACGLQVIPCYAPSEVAKGTSWKRPKNSVADQPIEIQKSTSCRFISGPPPVHRSTQLVCTTHTLICVNSLPLHRDRMISRPIAVPGGQDAREWTAPASQPQPGPSSTLGRITRSSLHRLRCNSSGSYGWCAL